MFVYIAFVRLYLWGRRLYGIKFIRTERSLPTLDNERLERAARVRSAALGRRSEDHDEGPQAALRRPVWRSVPRASAMRLVRRSDLEQRR